MFILDFWIAHSQDFAETLVPSDHRDMQEWPVYLRIGLYGALLECLGWWNLDVCFIFSGYLGTTQIATQVIVMQLKNFTTMIPSGVAFAASGLVGNCIGMNQVARGKNYAEVCIVFSMTVTLCMLMGFTYYADQLSHIFTTDEELATSVLGVFWSLFLYIFFSTVKGVQNGVVRALGQ